jgi:hypothetical protein
MPLQMSSWAKEGVVNWVNRFGARLALFVCRRHIKFLEAVQEELDKTEGQLSPQFFRNERDLRALREREENYLQIIHSASSRHDACNNKQEEV